jgi:hypothetical protein
VRFALVENRMRINQAIRGIRHFMAQEHSIVGAAGSEEARSAAV